MSTATTTTIVGNLTRDPEIRYTREGQATTSLGVAVNRRWQNRETNEWEESTSFFDVVTWRDLAENVALSLTKGMRVVVTGRLEQRSWETEDGDRRFKVEIVADEVGASLRFATVDVHKVERHRRHRPRPGRGRRRRAPTPTTNRSEREPDRSGRPVGQVVRQAVRWVRRSVGWPGPWPVATSRSPGRFSDCGCTPGSGSSIRPPSSSAPAR